VVLKPGAGITAGELRDHVKSQVAAYNLASRDRRNTSSWRCGL